MVALTIDETDWDWEDAEDVGCIDLSAAVEDFPALAFFPALMSTIAARVAIDWIEAYGSDRGLQEFIDSEPACIALAGAVFGSLHGYSAWAREAAYSAPTG